ncbi:MAG: hypothetical protein HYZ49_18820 [Chloroflexi bacterium]|nr:hypothetical protein [Chloroflexota bacterium]
MNIERSKKIFWVIVVVLALFSAVIMGLFFYLLFSQPQIVPLGETFGSFWIKTSAVLIAALAFASSALAAAYNSLEQRQLRYMENYPYLEVFPILSVDPLPLPIPKFDLPEELVGFNTEYLKRVAPSQKLKTSDTDFGYLGIALHNVGHGRITRILITGIAEVPSRGFHPINFKIKRRVNLPPEETIVFTLLPIAQLPEYKVQIASLEYSGHFVTMKDFDGPRVFQESYPFSIPQERKEILFFDDFENVPAGLGWVLDFWGQWKPTDYSYVPLPTGNDHYLVLSGDESQFSATNHYMSRGGAYKDLVNSLVYGQTIQVTVRVRSVPGTSASIQLWCHDLAANPKNRYSEKVIPQGEWQDISMLYTSTQTPHLRIHLLYFPGSGAIHVDKITVEKLHT